MTNTVNNAIPFVPENTTDPAAGLNLSLLTIDMLLNLSVESIGDTIPPATVLDGARYIVGVGATGLWLDHDNELAMWIDSPGYWQFRDVSFAFNKTTASFWVLNSIWEEYATSPATIVGEANTASNTGSGVGIYKQKVGVDLQLKSLVAGTGVTLDDTTNTNQIVINSSGGSAITSYSASLEANLAAPTANNWYTAVSLSLPAGKYLITSQLNMGKPGAGIYISSRISTGTVHYSSGVGESTSACPLQTISLSCIVTLASTTTINLQGSAAGSNATIMSAIITSSSGNNATQINAIKIG